MCYNNSSPLQVPLAPAGVRPPPERAGGGLPAAAGEGAAQRARVRAGRPQVPHRQRGAPPRRHARGLDGDAALPAARGAGPFYRYGDVFCSTYKLDLLHRHQEFVLGCYYLIPFESI